MQTRWATSSRQFIASPAGVQHHRAVHLSRKPDARNLLSAKLPLLERFVNSNSRGSPPIFRALLGPSGLGRGEGLVLLGGGDEDTPVTVHDQSASAARTNIDSENVGLHKFQGHY